jgi:hypothetical protein
VKWLLALLLLASGACRSSHCTRYADMEAKCGSAAPHDKAQTKTLARGMCEAADSSDPDVARGGAPFAKEADCAADADDCDAYKKCVAAIK